MRRTLLLTLLVSTGAHAGIINGSFEQGFLGWNFVGGFAPVGQIGPYAPTDGVLQGGIESILAPGINGRTVSELFGLPRVTVEHNGSLVTTNLFEILRQDVPPGQTPLDQCFGRDDCFGSDDSAALYQSFDVEAGQSIAFDFNFLAGDPTVGGWDAAFVSLVIGSSYTVVLLSDGLGNGLAPLDKSAPSVELLCGSVFRSERCDDVLQEYYVDIPSILEHGATGYHHVSLPVLESGIATLGFAVLSESSSFVEPSGLLIDRIRLTAVPEPSQLGLLTLALALLVGRTAWRAVLKSHRPDTRRL